MTLLDAVDYITYNKKLQDNYELAGHRKVLAYMNATQHKTIARIDSVLIKIKLWTSNILTRKLFHNNSMPVKPW